MAIDDTARDGKTWCPEAACAALRSATTRSARPNTPKTQETPGASGTGRAGQFDSAGQGWQSRETGPTSVPLVGECGP